MALCTEKRYWYKYIAKYKIFIMKLKMVPKQTLQVSHRQCVALAQATY